jgi:nucleotide-binding universal stress UspA family protein
LDSDSIGVQRIMQDVERDGIAAAKTAREAFRHWCAQHDLSETDKPRASERPTAEWCEGIGASSELIARTGRGVDVIVQPNLATPAKPDPIDVEAALFATGRPVLLAPAELPSDLFASAIVAWNGSPEANHAVAAALPLLSRCRRVTVFHEPESKHAAVEADELLDHLAWHDIRAERISANRGIGGGAGAQVLDAAARVNASLLVMGAYTHGRVRQMVFGGATRHVLHHATIPALLMH